jgi:hypothetical protein
MARYSSIISSPPVLRAEDAGRYVGCPGLLTRMVKAGWIKPLVQRKKMTLFLRSKLDECVERLTRGEFPEGQEA